MWEVHTVGGRAYRRDGAMWEGHTREVRQYGRGIQEGWGGHGRRTQQGRGTHLPQLTGTGPSPSSLRKQTTSWWPFC